MDRLCIISVLYLTTVFAGVSVFGGEVLHNGIELPDEWPPRMEQLPERLPTPPYLKQPPDVISIDVGRQLFVDDFLIEETNLTREFHQPVYHPANPVLTYDKPWEMSKARGGLPTACRLQRRHLVRPATEEVPHVVHGRLHRASVSGRIRRRHPLDEAGPGCRSRYEYRAESWSDGSELAAHGSRDS
jgi:hypothetical protein